MTTTMMEGSTRSIFPTIGSMEYPMAWNLPAWAVKEQEELESLGLIARVPYIRASDYETASKDEFQYYLKRRLGLVPAAYYSPALNQGSWFHVHAAYHFDSGMDHPDAQLAARKTELGRSLVERGTPAARIEAVLREEETDFQMTKAWWEAAKRLPIGKHGTIPEFLGQSRWLVLGTEQSFRTQLPNLPMAVLAARLDLLLYDKVANLVWIVDWKTSAEQTDTRLSTCLFEFQTNHYMLLVGLLLQKAQFRRRYGLPNNVQLGGMFHFAFQKPTIRLSGLDRDFTVDTTKPTAPKKYHGEPRYENYLRRVTDWVTGSGEYVGRETGNVVDFSQVDAGLLLDKRRMFRYQADLNWLMDLALRPPNPYLFRANINSVREFGDLNPWSAFYYTNVWEWPAVLKAGNFVIGHRDAEESYILEHVPDISAKRGYKRLTETGRARLTHATHPAVARFLQKAVEEGVGGGTNEGGDQAPGNPDAGGPGHHDGGDAGSEQLLAGDPPTVGPSTDSGGG